MNIGLVLSSPPKPSETFLNSLIQILSNEYDLTVFVSNKSKDLLRVNQIRFCNRTSSPFDVFRYMLKFICNFERYKSLRRTTPLKQLYHDTPVWTAKDLDYLHFAFGNLAFGREYYAEVIGCKMSVSFRGSDINVFPKWHHLSYNGILNRCEKVHCNSQTLKMEVLKYDAEYYSKIVVINPGLQASFDLSDEEVGLLSRERLNKRKTIFISIGRLHWIKGFELVFEALGKLKKDGIEFEYHLIGQGDEGEKLVFLSFFYDIQDRVKFLGMQKPSEIRKYLESANLFLHTSWAEGFSNATLEAQALGLPVIVTPISGMNEIVLHKETGFIVRDHSSKSIYEGINWYFSLTNEFKYSLAIKANKVVKNNFSMESLGNNWISFFNEN